MDGPARPRSPIRSTLHGMEGQLFAEKKFFLVQRLPSRSGFIDQIRTRGGRVVKLEDQADYIIADHLRKDAPNGSLSYTFIEAAIRDGAIPDEQEHRAGHPKDTIREVGSAKPGKSTRTPFTAEDDRELYDHVESFRAEGGAWKGNDIYKQLEAKNPRHTFQSYRDRYIKVLSIKKPVLPPNNAPPTPPVERATSPATEQRSDAHTFTHADFVELIKASDDIQNITFGNLGQAWQAWTEANPRHTAREWRNYYEDTVLPVYLEQQAATSKAPLPRAEEKKSEIPLRTFDGAAESALEDAVPRKRRRLNSPEVVLQRATAKKKLHPHAKTAQQVNVAAADEGAADGGPADEELAALASDGESDMEEPDTFQTFEADYAAQVQLQEEMTRQSMLPLTAKNLAQVQAHHEGKLQDDATDIPKDDEDNDQTEYAQYLSTLVHGEIIPRKFATDPPQSTAQAGPNTSVMGVFGDDAVSALNELAPKASRPVTKATTETATPPPPFEPTSSQPFDFDIPSPGPGMQPLGDEADELIDLSLEPLDPEDPWQKSSPSHSLDPELPWQKSSPSHSLDPDLPPIEDVMSDTRDKGKARTYDTQAIYNAETQDFDPDVPDPDFDLEEPPLAHDSEEEGLGQQAFIDEMAYLGYSDEDILTALEHSSMHADRSLIILESLAAGRGVPTNVAGIWTEEDDKWLQGSDANLIGRLESKHGTAQINTRMMYLTSFK